MKRIEGYPPLDWHEVVILWTDIIKKQSYHSIIEWLDKTIEGCYYHIDRFNQTEGIAFRFEQRGDAILFKLKWA